MLKLTIERVIAIDESMQKTAHIKEMILLHVNCSLFCFATCHGIFCDEYSTSD